jgi:hypothetical protein
MLCCLCFLFNFCPRRRTDGLIDRRVVTPPSKVDFNFVSRYFLQVLNNLTSALLGNFEETKPGNTDKKKRYCINNHFLFVVILMIIRIGCFTVLKFRPSSTPINHEEEVLLAIDIVSNLPTGDTPSIVQYNTHDIVLF